MVGRRPPRLERALGYCFYHLQLSCRRSKHHVKPRRQRIDPPGRIRQHSGEIATGRRLGKAIEERLETLLHLVRAHRLVVARVRAGEGGRRGGDDRRPLPTEKAHRFHRAPACGVHSQRQVQDPRGWWQMGHWTLRQSELASCPRPPRSPESSRRRSPQGWRSTSPRAGSCGHSRAAPLGPHRVGRGASLRVLHTRAGGATGLSGRSAGV